MRPPLHVLAAFAALAAVAAPPAARAGAALPDLTAYAEDVFVDRDTTVVPGDVAEGCASATSGVDLLRFSTFTSNGGDADLAIGDPVCPDCDENPGAVCGNPLFHCSPADGHGHGHWTDYAIYELLDASQQVVATGGKLGFCLIDSFCEAGQLPAYLSCSFQGLSAGCTDEYAYTLGCQYVEITGLPDGSYTLRISVDPLAEIEEADETNNVYTRPVTLGESTEPDEGLLGTRLRLTARQTATRLRLVAEPSGPLALPAPDHAPTETGATLSVTEEGAPGNALSFDLPAAGWKGLGKPEGSDGWRFRGGAGSPCRKARLGDGGLRARCEGAGLSLPVGGALEVVFTTSGAKRYCARFGGTEKRNGARRLERVKAGVADCPTP